MQEEKKGLLKVFYVSENMKPFRKRLMEPLEHLLELGGIRKDITLLVLSGIAVVLSLAGVQPLPFDIAWAAIILCGVPIILAITGILNPVVGALVHNAGSVRVIINSALLLNWRKKS